MFKNMKIQFFLSIVILLSIGLYPAAILCETSCEQAEELFQKSLMTNQLPLTKCQF